MRSIVRTSHDMHFPRKFGWILHRPRHVLKLVCLVTSMSRWRIALGVDRVHPPSYSSIRTSRYAAPACEWATETYKLDRRSALAVLRGNSLISARYDASSSFNAGTFAGPGVRPVGALLIAPAGGWLEQTAYSRCRQHRSLGCAEAVQPQCRGEVARRYRLEERDQMPLRLRL